MRAENENGRPWQGGPVSSTAIQDDPSLRRPVDVLAELDALAERLRGRFVVQVTIDGDYRRTNVYRSAAAAERAVDRAAARGQGAHVTMCQMLPVGVLHGLGGAR